MTADSEVGGMNEEKTRAVFDAATADLRRCFTEGSQRVEFLAGTVQFSVEVNASGKLDRAYLKDSTLGDRATERCMLEALTGRPWPRPVGGRIGRADGGFEFEADSSVRPPVDWSTADVERALTKLRRRIDACKGSSPGAYRATMYVGTKGEVLSVGVAMPRGNDERAADCLIGVLARGRYPSPGSWPAKVTFDL
ncbi:MAG: AgmX/PglI C-terminal domain-containing protein [Polyangiaceae bacterium]|nr:AgmX/PglI C-terminal domain-containing protein [Polyangiaceae bacterium]